MKTPAPEFFCLDEVVHHQACDFIKKRLQQRCFTVNIAKFLQSTGPSAHWSDFDLTVFNTIYLALT